MKKHATLFSQLSHFLVFLVKRPKAQFEKGMLIVSVDVDVGNRELGVLNKGQNDANIGRSFSEFLIGKIEERALPMFIALFNDFEVPVTFAIRGQLMEVDASILNFFGNSMKHDIGAHGYYHRPFTSLSRTEAEKELEKIHVAMKKFDIIPRSFVFPKNRVAHLDLLEKYGYECYRGSGGLMKDCMHIEKQGSLFNICPSLCVSQRLNSKLLKQILDVSIVRKLPFHIWLHLWDFGETKESMQRSINNVFVPLLKYAKKKEKMDMLTFETMLSAAEKVGKHLQAPRGL